uniref:Uncharacterized protein n=1 Tax=Avena sativa TaxID=4498 RepID=A0ACD5XGR5_AVESA
MMDNMLPESAGSDMVKLETMATESRTGTDFPLQASAADADMVKLETMAISKQIHEISTDFAVLVRVTASVECTQRHSLDLVAVLDTSGSMGNDGKLERMQEAMVFVIDNLSDDDRLSMVPFRGTRNDHARCPPTVMSAENREKLKTKVKELQSADKAGDDPGAANEAAKVLSQRAPDEKSSHIGCIIYLSDGEYIVDDVISKYPIYTFGLGADHSPKTLQEISDKSKGVYSYVNNNLEKMKEAFAQWIGGLTSVIAINLNIKVRTHEGVGISSIESGSYESSFNSYENCFKDQVGTIQINELYAGETKNFIVYLTVPAEGKEHLVTVNGSYKNGKNDTIQLGESKVFVERPNERTTSNEVVHSEVAGELARLQLVKDISDMAENGEFDKNKVQMLWDKIKKSINGRNAPEKTMSDLGNAVSVMLGEVEGKGFFMSSWLTSQKWQRSTTKGFPSESGDFQTAAMKNMLRIANKQKGYHLELKDKLKTTSNGNNITNSSLVDVSNHPGWSKMEKALNVTMLNIMQDTGTTSLFNGASVEEMRHAANRYLYLAIVHTSVLGSRCNDTANICQVEEKVKSLEAEKKHLLAALQRANTTIVELVKQVEDKNTFADNLLADIANAKAHLKTCGQRVIMLEAKVREMEGIVIDEPMIN